MKRVMQDAIAFAGADWENLPYASREKLLSGNRLNPEMSRLRWGRLPPTVKQALAKPLIKEIRN